MPPLGHENAVARTMGKLSPEQVEQHARLRELEEEVKLHVESTAPAQVKPGIFRRVPMACSVEVSHGLQEDGSERLVSWLVRDFVRVSLVTQRQRKMDVIGQTQFIPVEQPQERLKLYGKSLYFEAGDFGESRYGGTPVGFMRNKPTEYETVLKDIVDTLDLIRAAEITKSLGEAAVTS